MSARTLASADAINYAPRDFGLKAGNGMRRGDPARAGRLGEERMLVRLRTYIREMVSLALYKPRPKRIIFKVFKRMVRSKTNPIFFM